MTHQLIWVYSAWALLASLVTFALYGWDKRRARRGGQRTRERTLHLWAGFGGWPGAWAGQRWFRHKTQKVSFRRVYYASVVLNCAVVAALAWLVLR